MDSAGQEVIKRLAEEEVSDDDDFRSTTSVSRPTQEKYSISKVICADQDDQDSGTMDIVSNAPT